MNKILSSTLVVSAILFAQSKNYIGIGFGKSNSNSYTIPKESNSEITLRYGYELFDFLGLEARGEFFGGGGKRLEHSASYGLFLKPNYDISSKINIYGLYGYTRNILSKKSKIYSNKDTTIQDDISYGGGIEYKIGKKNIYIYADYINYIDKSTIKDDGKYAIKIDTLSVGVNIKFGSHTQKSYKKAKYPTINTYLPKFKPISTITTEPQVGQDIPIFDDFYDLYPQYKTKEIF